MIEVMSNFETVLISAITSAGVALSIEWAAKPRLEARKERILEQAKAKRDIEQNLSIIIIIGSSLSGDFSSLDAAERRIALSILEERRADVVSASKAIESSLAVAGPKMRARTRSSSAMPWLGLVESQNRTNCDLMLVKSSQ